jgi:hypothetical protein
VLKHMAPTAASCEQAAGRQMLPAHAVVEVKVHARRSLNLDGGSVLGDTAAAPVATRAPTSLSRASGPVLKAMSPSANSKAPLPAPETPLSPGRPRMCCRRLFAPFAGCICP